VGGNLKLTPDGETSISDANIVAFLVMKGYIAIPYIESEMSGKSGSRVAWDVQGKGVDEEITRYYSNEKVGIQDFVRSLKATRSSMYNTKHINKQLRQAD
jgi:hypothetical protein